MTITVGGRFQTKEQMLQALENYFPITRTTKEIILDEEFTPTPPEKRYTVDIAVVTMLEAGITEPATLQESKDVYWEQGYGPLTFDEVLELRLQLKDQPNSATGHRMNNFFTLPASSYTTTCSYYIRNLKIGKEAKKRISAGNYLEGEFLHDPNEVYLHQYDEWVDVAISPQELPRRFAATVRGSVVRK